MTAEALPVPVYRHPLFKGFAAVAAVIVIWSGFNIMSRLGGRSPLTPYDMAAIRFVFSGLVCLPFVLMRWRRLDWPRLAVLGGMGYALLVYLLFLPKALHSVSLPFILGQGVYQGILAASFASLLLPTPSITSARSAPRSCWPWCPACRRWPLYRYWVSRFTPSPWRAWCWSRQARCWEPRIRQAGKFAWPGSRHAQMPHLDEDRAALAAERLMPAHMRAA